MSTPGAGGSGPRRPTMADVARLAGVSLKTVSRVVNNVPTVDRELAERVTSAVAELGFRRNDMARNLRAGNTSATVGLLIEDLANPFYAGIAAAAAQYALEHDTMLITASSEENAGRERALLLEMCQRRVDGLLVVPAGDADHVYLRPEIERGTPVVFLDRPPRNLLADTVLIDNAGGARQAIEHLVAAGHERIGVISDWLSISTMAERLTAAQEALERAGVPYRADLIKYGLHTVPDAQAAVTEMLAGPEPPTAIFALNNRLTLGALGALDNRLRPDAPGGTPGHPPRTPHHGATPDAPHRRTTPDAHGAMGDRPGPGGGGSGGGGGRVELVGFDDFETAAFVPWRLTVVSYDVREIGRMGAELLFRRIAGDRSRPRKVVVPTELIVRSVG
ncbi:LacI family DNA-binding transcriptional regulator [Nonomuraea angiospora]|uniref:LacI family transcriptional regulator n=2 Tax=Nonomuraea angiospora TaxID=46172 RepID=A0ABR9LST5_9ACTN|nr:LacI family DNA-binding transcriptional regulator [Nonomuraea angiospora]MBE1583711.1 LacI family transcriptional regulator [Nonomuraea angiospora]